MRWFGHLERMDDERLTKKVYKGNVRGKRGRGRPRKEWLDQIGEIAKEWNLQSENKRRVCMKKVMTAKSGGASAEVPATPNETVAGYSTVQYRNQLHTNL